MNEIIKKIEDAQLRADVPQFRTGDTVRVYAKIKEGDKQGYFYSKKVLRRYRRREDLAAAFSDRREGRCDQTR